VSLRWYARSIFPKKGLLHVYIIQGRILGMQPICKATYKCIDTYIQCYETMPAFIFEVETHPFIIQVVIITHSG